MHYEWGYHSSDAQHVHVARVDGTRREDLFDVTLYDPECPATDGADDSAMDQSLRDLKALLGTANMGLEAIERVQKMRKELVAEAPADHDDDGWDEMDSEDTRAHFAALETYDAVLDVLQILAHGGTPAQGQ